MVSHPNSPLPSIPLTSPFGRLPATLSHSLIYNPLTPVRARHGNYPRLCNPERSRRVFLFLRAAGCHRAVAHVNQNKSSCFFRESANHLTGGLENSNTISVICFWVLCVVMWRSWCLFTCHTNNNRLWQPQRHARHLSALTSMQLYL